MAAATIEKHELNFEMRPAYFPFMCVDGNTHEEYDEDRFVGSGLLKGRVMALVFAESHLDTVHVISLQKSLAAKRRLHEQFLHDELGEI